MKSEKKSLKLDNEIQVPADKKCETCDKVFKTAFTYKAHMSGHKENDCTKCEVKCHTRKMLVAHLRSAHFLDTAEKYYNCKFCKRKFVKKPSLWFHYKSHATETQVIFGRGW